MVGQPFGDENLLLIVVEITRQVSLAALSTRLGACTSNLLLSAAVTTAYELAGTIPIHVTGLKKGDLRIGSPLPHAMLLPTGNIRGLGT